MYICLPLRFHKRHYIDKHSVLWIPLLDDIIGKFSLLEVVVYICLPQSVTVYLDSLEPYVYLYLFWFVLQY